jgi:hypothetical protein
METARSAGLDLALRGPITERGQTQADRLTLIPNVL